MNGRAVHDLDLPHGAERAVLLLRRAYALSRAVLEQPEAMSMSR